MLLLIVAALIVAIALGWWLGHRRLAQAAPPPVETNDAQAMQHERERIYKDLHDDIGAKLLQLVHGAESPQQADLARAVLQDLRDVVSRSRRPPAPLLQLLGEIEAEVRQRLAAADAEMLWEQEAGLADVALDQAQTLHLMRIGREAVSNALQHGAAHWLRVRVFRAGAELVLEITDDGRFSPAQIGEGRGTTSMRERAKGLGGDIHWNPGTLGGTKVILRARVFPASGLP
ncbi:MAG: ATP-binding protein [Stagnimonas sp.]|nr:ATP-binding protein [Stagnimonas sp.]